MGKQQVIMLTETQSKLQKLRNAETIRMVREGKSGSSTKLDSINKQLRLNRGIALFNQYV